MRTTDLKNAKCAQPAIYAGVGILKLTKDPTFCKDDDNEIDGGLLIILYEGLVLRECYESDILTNYLLRLFSSYAFFTRTYTYVKV